METWTKTCGPNPSGLILTHTTHPVVGFLSDFGVYTCIFFEGTLLGAEVK